jgi:hypothetical protein
LSKVFALTLPEAANRISTARATGLFENISLPGQFVICPEKNSRSDPYKDDPQGLSLNIPLDKFALIEAYLVL